MTLSAAERDTRADATAGRLSHYTLFNGDPFAAGSEVAGITRAAASWDAASGGSAAQTGSVEITVPAGSTFDTLVGMDAATGGTAVAKKSLGSNTFANGGTVDVTSATIAG